MVIDEILWSHIICSKSGAGFAFRILNKPERQEVDKLLFLLITIGFGQQFAHIGANCISFLQVAPLGTMK